MSGKTNLPSVLYHETGELQAAPEDMSIRELAERVYEERARITKIGREQNVPYYLLNIRHPAVRALYDALKAKLGPWPLGDIERLTWELGLMSEETRAAMAAWFLDRDAAVGKMLGRDKGGTAE